MPIKLDFTHQNQISNIKSATAINYSPNRLPLIILKYSAEDHIVLCCLCVVQTEARRRGQSVTHYEEGEYYNTARRERERERESKPKSGFGARLSKFFGGGKSTSEQGRGQHHMYGKVGTFHQHSGCYYVP